MNNLELAAKVAHKNHEEIINLKRQFGSWWLELGKKLRENRDKKYYKILGYKTFEAYLATPEIDIDRKWAFAFIRVYDRFVVDLKVAPAPLIEAGYSKLDKIRKQVNEENIDEWLEKAKVLSRSDLDAELHPKDKAITVPPNGKYNVVVIDPPWNYGTQYDEFNRRIASPYPEMTQEELKNIEIPFAKDCILWLWTTHKFMWDAKELMDHWGFDYKLCFVWDKQKMGMGSWLRCQVEFCLLGIKGSPAWESKSERDIIRIARREHSRKPDEFYKMVERISPSAKRLDIFSREVRKGWEQYGNETRKYNI